MAERIAIVVDCFGGEDDAEDGSLHKQKLPIAAFRKPPQHHELLPHHSSPSHHLALRPSANGRF